MERVEKDSEIKFLTDCFANSQIALSADYVGLNVAKFTKLRRSLRKVGATAKVIKNTFGKRATDTSCGSKVKAEELQKFKDTLVGPSFVIFCEDPVAPAKVLIDFAKDKETPLKIKGALFEGSFIDPKGVDSLSKMPGKAETLAALLRVINAPATQLLRMVQAPGEQLTRVIEAHRKNLEKKAA